MIGYIKGNITEIGEESVFIETKFGIAVELIVSSKTVQFCKSIHDEVKLYIYLISREEQVSVFGFYSKEEKDIFLKLINVNGVGPKGAITILSNIEIADLVNAIQLQNIKYLTKIKGIGKKTAERLVLELKSQLSDSPTEVEFFAPIDEVTNDETEAINTLVDSLGFTRQEAVHAVKLAKPDAKNFEDLIRLAIQRIR